MNQDLAVLFNTTRTLDQFFGIFVYLNSDRQIHTRSIYTALDWLGDVGGLIDGLRIIGTFSMTLYSFIVGSSVEKYILQSVFKKGHRNERYDESEQSILKSIAARKSMRIPTILFGCLGSRKERALRKKGIDRAFRELDIDQFIKKQLQLKMMMRTIFTQTERFLLKSSRALTLRQEHHKRETTSDSSFDEKSIVKGPYFEKLLKGA